MPDLRHEAAAQDAAPPDIEPFEPTPDHRVVSPDSHELYLGIDPRWPTISCSCGWGTPANRFDTTKAIFEHGWSVGYDVGINL